MSKTYIMNGKKIIGYTVEEAKERGSKKIKKFAEELRMELREARAKNNSEKLENV